MKKIKLDHELGTTLKILRGKNPVSETAKALGVSSTILYKLEAGERLPTLLHLKALARVYGQPIQLTIPSE